LIQVNEPVGLLALSNVTVISFTRFVVVANYACSGSHKREPVVKDIPLPGWIVTAGIRSLAWPRIVQE
jgi:hypothetical protein